MSSDFVNFCKRDKREDELLFMHQRKGVLILPIATENVFTKTLIVLTKNSALSSPRLTEPV